MDKIDNLLGYKNSIKKIFGKRPVGWYTGRCSTNTLDLVINEGGFLYQASFDFFDMNYP